MGVFGGFAQKRCRNPSSRSMHFGVRNLLRNGSFSGSFRVACRRVFPKFNRLSDFPWNGRTTSDQHDDIPLIYVLEDNLGAQKLHRCCLDLQSTMLTTP